MIADPPIYEPTPRMVAGSFGYARHRFPIKGGITLRQVMALQIKGQAGFMSALSKPSYFANRLGSAKK